eukprot:scaffold2028_cov181-Ochromonas_danica.AAC.4
MEWNRIGLDDKMMMKKMTTWWTVLFLSLSLGTLALRQPPSDWQERINTYNAFFAESDDSTALNPKTGYPFDLYLVSYPLPPPPPPLPPIKQSLE